MVNLVTAGRFKGKRIKVNSEGAFIPFGREHLDIMPEIVDHIKIISAMQNRRFFSGFLRGFFAKWLGNTAWLSAVQSAQSQSQFRIRIAYRDGTASVCVIDNRVLDQLAVTFDLI
jgi:hypothetical protein